MLSADGRLYPSKTRAIAYIDGFNLYYGLKSASQAADRLHLQNGGSLAECLGRSLYWLDIGVVIRSQLHPSEDCSSIKYFSAPRRVPELVTVSAEQRKDIEASNERQRIFLDAIRSRAIEVELGWYSEKNPHRCRVCGDVRASFEEKGTDVNIATQMVADAYEDRYDLAIVMSADADLVAPIKAVQRIGKSVRLLLPPGRKRAKHLRAVVKDAREITIKTIRTMIMPDTIERGEFPALRRPAEWCVPQCWVWDSDPPPLRSISDVPKD